jgi:hypothetical protein
MSRLLPAFLAVAFALSLGSVASAKACRDTKTGKFIKCPPAAAATSKAAKPKQCKDPKTGKFIKCTK